MGAVSGLAACCLIVLLVWGIGGNQAKPGESEFLAVIRKTDPAMAGEAFPYMADMQYAQGDRSALSASRRFYFDCRKINVVARVSEDLGRYEMLHEYGSWQGRAYRLLLMEVIDPLQSGLEGAFYYLLPERLQADLTGCDALLISMVQLPSDFTLRRGEELTAFAYLFADPWDTPELGNMLAFQNGVFDEKFWLDMRGPKS